MLYWTRLAVAIFALVMSQPACAQSSYDFNLKDQPYLEGAGRTDCVETPTTIEILICANLKLQKEDSLLHQEYRSLVDWLQQKGKKATADKLRMAQEGWEKYRFLHCENMVEDGGYAARFESIAFMRCGIEMTEKRRKEIADVRENIILDDE